MVDATASTGGGNRPALGRAIAIAAGVVCTLVLLELGLRLGGVVYAWHQTHRSAVALQGGDDFRVMCIGESTTAIGGADSYPSQLQEILQESLPDKRVTVINCGIPGGNTRIILENLQQNLDAWKPHVVVAMMGENDSGDAVPFAALDEQSGMLAHLRVYRLYRYLRAFFARRGDLPVLAQPASDSPSPTSEDAPGNGSPVGSHVETSSKSRVRQTSNFHTRKGRLLEQQARVPEAIRELQIAEAVDPTNPRPLKALAEIEMMRFSRYDEAIRMLRRVLELSPSDSIARLDLAYCFETTNRSADAEEMYARVLQDRWDGRTGRRQHFTALARYLLRHKLDADAERLFELLLRQPANREAVLACGSWYWGQRGDASRRAAFDERLQALLQGSFVGETRANYLELQRVLKQRGIQLVCLQYACRPVEPLIRLFSDRDDIIFVENDKNFRAAIQAGGFFDLFIDNCYGDMGHCTRKGNRMIAQSVADAILKP